MLNPGSILAAKLPAHMQLTQVTKQTNRFQRVLESKEPQRWLIKDIIGAGTFGAVYKVRDKRLHTVALKAIWAHRHVGEFSAKEQRLLRREMTAMQRCIHANVVRLYESHFADDMSAFWLVLEFVNGLNLRQILVKDGVWRSDVQLIAPTLTFLTPQLTIGSMMQSDVHWISLMQLITFTR